MHQNREIGELLSLYALFMHMSDAHMTHVAVMRFRLRSVALLCGLYDVALN